MLSLTNLARSGLSRFLNSSSTFKYSNTEFNSYSATSICLEIMSLTALAAVSLIFLLVLLRRLEMEEKLFISLFPLLFNTSLSSLSI
ncbi:MAG: hypothetical protein ACD_24C00037G0001, partial [uncultured bacterium]